MKSIQTISSGFSAKISLTAWTAIAYKIGRIVFLYGYIRNATNGIVVTGELKCLTLPASIRPVTDYVTLAVLNSTNTDTVTECIIHNDDNSVYVHPHPASSGTSLGKSYIHFSGMYISRS